jgi:hypothetical protein
MRNAETILGVIQKPLESRGEIERLMPGSAGGGWKRAAQAAPRWPPTLLHVRFGGGRMEKGVMTYLASRLPDRARFGVVGPTRATRLAVPRPERRPQQRRNPVRWFGRPLSAE